MSRKLLKLLRRGGETWIRANALLYDKFTTAAAAPITSPRTCEPGPGLATIVDTENKFTIAGASLVCAGGKAAPGYGDPGIWLGRNNAGSPATQTTVAGDAAFLDFVINTGGYFEFGADTAVSGALFVPYWYFEPNLLNLFVADQSLGLVPLGPITTSTQLKLMRVQRSDTIGYYFIKDGKLLWPSAATTAGTPSYVAIANYSTAFTAADLALLPLADYNAAWGGDWTEVTDTDATPAATESVDRDAGSALIELGDITLPSDAMAVQIRRVDTTNYTTLDIAADGSATIKETIAGSEGAALVSIGAGGISDASSLKVLDNAGAVKVFSAGVLAGSATLTDHSEAVLVYIEALGTGGALSAVTTHPYPALGIATSRVVCPQTTNTYTHAADFIAEIKNVTLPAANDLSFQFRISGSDELTLNLASDGSLALLDNATSRITAAGGTVSSTDDIVFVCDGANGQIFVDGTSAGTTTAIAHLTGTAGKRLDATTGVCDHIALFPRDISGLLPKGTF